jgi:hypothetical protein
VAAAHAHPRPGRLGSCTGKAACGALGTDPFYGSLAGKLQTGLKLDEAEAVSLYSAATRLDPYSGSYPPDDTGSDGLSVAKAAKNAGLISGYVHALSLDAVVTALQTGPVITGVNWDEGFDSPDASGNVSISGSVRGGHEFEIVAVDVDAKRFRAPNSWAERWGDKGYFQFSYADYERLLSEDGDATQFVPIAAPAPTPTPTPGEFPWADGDAWLDFPHWWSRATRAAKAIKACEATSTGADSNVRLQLLVPATPRGPNRTLLTATYSAAPLDHTGRWSSGAAFVMPGANGREVLGASSSR